MAKHITVSMTPEDDALIKKLKRVLAPIHGTLSTTALFRLTLRNMVKEVK